MVWMRPQRRGSWGMEDSSSSTGGASNRRRSRIEIGQHLCGDLIAMRAEAMLEEYRMAFPRSQRAVFAAIIMDGVAADAHGLGCVEDIVHRHLPTFQARSQRQRLEHRTQLVAPWSWPG
jgi:hypothetical protein